MQRQCSALRGWQRGQVGGLGAAFGTPFSALHLRTGLGDSLPTSRIVQPLPQAQVAAELAFFVVELGVLLVGLGLLLQRAVAHVLHA